MEEKKKMIVLTGPTAVGKTSLSIELAKKLNGEIISADSMQVYKNLDIGNAKITKEAMAGVTHYLVDELDPKEPFDVFRFQQMAKLALEKIYAKGKIPIIVGGTGFYIQALIYDIDFSENEDDEKDGMIRRECEELYKEKGEQYLHDMLRGLDEQSANDIHPNNVKRVIRAIAFCKTNNITFSQHNREQKQKSSPYDVKYYVLTNHREVLYQRIDERVDVMIENGLVEEVAKLKEMGVTRKHTSMQGLGYKEILDYLDGIISLEESVDLIKKETRHFAKRQLTWFRREKEVIWIDKSQYEDEKAIIDFITT